VLEDVMDDPRSAARLQEPYEPVGDLVSSLRRVALSSAAERSLSAAQKRLDAFAAVNRDRGT
jgi:hypothetical protein